MGKPLRDVRMSLQTLRVLEAFLENPTQELAGADVQKRGPLASGTLYPILMRLQKLGWLETRWEQETTAGRPPRHLYRLTGNGREWAREELRAARESKFYRQSLAEAAK